MGEQTGIVSSQSALGKVHPTTDHTVRWKPSPLFSAGGPINVAWRITSVD